MTTTGAALASSSSCYYCNCSSSLFCPSYSYYSSYNLNIILTTTVQYPFSSFSSIGGPRQQNQRFTKSKSKRNAKIDTHALLLSSSKLGNQRITSSNANAGAAVHHLFQTIKSKHIPNPSARGTIAPSSSSSSSSSPSQQQEEEFRVLTALTTKYNDIVIVETSTSRILLLDSTHNVHSIFNLQKENGGDDHNHLWTNSYWDEFASLPAIVPQGPIALLGLGGGTSARLMLHSCPSLNIHAWEIDSILIDKSREFLGLSDLEKCTQVGGLLVVHVGDALSPLASIPGGFSGIVVDLFSNGKVLPQLQEVTTWLELNNKLMSHGRIMVNCGGADIETTEFKDRRTHHSSSSDDGLWVHNSTIKALCKAFPGKLSWKKMGGNHGENYLALTGPFPDLDEWSTSVPEKLSMSVKSWQPCHISA